MKRKTLLEQAKAEISRIKRFISSAEKRGFRFESNLVPQLPKRVTAKTVERLKKIKPETLYKKATAVSKVTGKIVTGTQARKEERQIAASKGYQRRKAAEAAQRQLANKFVEGRITLNNIIILISSHPSPSAAYLRNILNYNISKYGEESVIRSLSEQPEEAIQLAQEIVYYEAKTKEEKHRQLKVFAEMIAGFKFDVGESKELGELFDATTDMS